MHPREGLCAPTQGARSLTIAAPSEWAFTAWGASLAVPYAGSGLGILSILSLGGQFGGEFGRQDWKGSNVNPPERPATQNPPTTAMQGSRVDMSLLLLEISTSATTILLLPQLANPPGWAPGVRGREGSNLLLAKTWLRGMAAPNMNLAASAPSPADKPR